MPASNVDELILERNLVLEKFLSDLTINGLKINTVKSEDIVFRSVSRHVTSNYDLKFGADKIEIV